MGKWSGFSMTPWDKAENRRKAWVVLLGCCLMQGGSLGLVQDSMGVFFSAVSRDLGFSLGGISLYRTISGLSSCLLLPFVGRILYCLDTRVSLTVSSVVYAGITLLMAGFTQLWQWYAASFFLGLAGAMLLSSAAPIILENWYPKSLGLAVGLSASFSGFMGILGNMGAGWITERWGWRRAYLLVGLMSMVMLVTASLFLIRLSPEKQKAPGSQRGLPQSRLSGRAWVPAGLVTLMSIAITFCVGFSPEIVAFCQASGRTVAFGTSMVSLTMLTNALGKLLLGRLHDRFGLRVCCLTGSLIAAASFVLLLLPQTLPVVAGAVLYGIGMATSVVTPPLLIRACYGPRDYPRVYSLVLMLFTLGSAFGPSAIGAIYDASGSFRGGVLLCMVCALGYLAIGGILVLWCRRESANSRKKTVIGQPVQQ